MRGLGTSRQIRTPRQDVAPARPGVSLLWLVARIGLTFEGAHRHSGVRHIGADIVRRTCPGKVTGAPFYVT